MLEVLKQITAKFATKWQAEIDGSDGKSKTFSVKEFQEIFGQNMVHIVFGEDITDQLFELQVPQGKGSKKFESKKFDINSALEIVMAQVLEGNFYKSMHPIGMLIKMSTGKRVSLTAYQKTVSQNCFTVRKFIRDYVHKRQ